MKHLKKYDDISENVEDAKIVAVGDSITVGVGNGGTSYIDMLKGDKYAVGGKASFQKEN